jgi:hypothetical protein
MNRIRRIIHIVRSLPEALELLVDHPEARELIRVSDIAAGALLCILAGGILAGALGQIFTHRF